MYTVLYSTGLRIPEIVYFKYLYSVVLQCLSLFHIISQDLPSQDPVIYFKNTNAQFNNVKSDKQRNAVFSMIKYEI